MRIRCPQCGFSRELPEEKAPAGSVIARCPKCHCRFRFSRKDGAGEIIPADHDDDDDIRAVANSAYQKEAQRFENEQGAAQAARQRQLARNPWEDAPGEFGWIAAFYQTALRVMFQAPLFFKNLRPQTQIWRPLAFFVAICIIQTLVERAWGEALRGFLASYSANDPQLENLLRALAPAASLPLALLLRVGSLLLQLFVFSLLMYLAYKIVARERANFMLIWQIMAYSAAPWLLCVVPGIGSIAGAIWGIGCLAAGCKAALDLNWGQTLAGFAPIAAVLIPLLPQIGQLMGM